MSTGVEGGEDANPPAFQVIVLGAGGGPQEHNVTALLIRSLDSGWGEGSVVALDAGVHLSSIIRILESTQPPGLGTDVALPHVLETGPFAGIEIMSASATTNAAHISQHLIDTYLITHPHLDHISGFVINTAGLPVTRPKRLAGLPSTISAFKKHIFNNVIWPNLSDENNGAGLVTYMRLQEGGMPALGGGEGEREGEREGEGKGYLDVTDGLGVMMFSVSHGHCIERHAHRGSGASSRYGSFDGLSLLASSRTMSSGNIPPCPSPLLKASIDASREKESICVYDSSAYFIRDNATAREILVFGDVEPDIVSLSPRNLGIWQEAAVRIVNGSLVAIFIECSYDNSQADACLFGHLSPKYLMQELQVLGSAVEVARQTSKPDAIKKRKREASLTTTATTTTTTTTTTTHQHQHQHQHHPQHHHHNHLDAGVVITVNGEDRPISPKSSRPPNKKIPISWENNSENGMDTPHLATPTAEMSLEESEFKTMPAPPPPPPSPPRVLRAPKGRDVLKGVKVVIIHVKEKLVDGNEPRETILKELLEAEEEAGLGCEFVVSTMGQSFLL